MSHGISAGPETTLHPLHIQSPYYESHHDPYFLKAKLSNGSACTNCGVVYRNGKFCWEKPTVGEVKDILCPACRKTQDDFPGGLVSLEGNFLKGHETEIRNLIVNVEKIEKNEHPLERIMFIGEQDGGLQITTTYEHLARRIGEAVHRAYKGKLSLRYAEDEKEVFVSWNRD